MITTKHFWASSLEPVLPLMIESIGTNSEQEKISRPEGYPYFHWLATLEGSGEFLWNGQSFLLPPGSGVLMFPNCSHSYFAVTEPWVSCYVTFEGVLAEPMLNMLGFHHSAYYQWEDDHVNASFHTMLEAFEHQYDATGLEGSGQLYQFLIQLKKYGKHNKMPSLSTHIDRLRPLILWLEEQLSDPSIGLTEMAQRLEISPRHANTLFRRAFGLSAYAYLITLRMRRAKDMLYNERQLSVKAISARVGYRDVSHFVATFKKMEGMTPEQFRLLY